MIDIVPPPLLTTLDADWAQAFVGIPFPLMVRLTCPTSETDSYRVRNIDCNDKGIQLNSDLLQRDVELRPGESYRFKLELTISRLGVVNLSSIYVQVVGRESIIFPLPVQYLQIRPALGKDILVSHQPICSYNSVTKLQLTFHNQGQTTYENFRVSFGPENVVKAAKQQLIRAVFKPGEVESVVVAASGDLELTLVATGEDKASLHVQKTIPVRPVEGRSVLPFRFLEPDELSSDQIVIRDKERKGEPVGLDRSAYPLVGGGSYQVVIRPQQPGVTEIRMQDVAGSIYVRSSSFDKDENGWTFDIDIAFNELLTRPERLVYRVKRKDGPLTGEIYVSLTPPPLKYWKFALAAGVAATIQGAASLTHVLFTAETNVDEIVENLLHSHNYSPLLVFSVPLLWCATLLFDRVQTRLRG